MLTTVCTFTENSESKLTRHSFDFEHLYLFFVLANSYLWLNNLIAFSGEVDLNFIIQLHICEYF